MKSIGVLLFVIVAQILLVAANHTDITRECVTKGKYDLFTGVTISCKAEK